MPATVLATTSVTVNPAPANSFLVTGFPNPATAGTAGTITVTAKDAYGNTATSYSDTVHFTSTDAQAGLPSDTGLTNGVGTFTVTLKTAGTQSIIVADTVNSTLSGTQASISVNPSSASSLVVSGFPNPVTAGVASSITVTAKGYLRQYSNRLHGYGTFHIK